VHIFSDRWFHQASYPVSTGFSFPGVKRPEDEADHLPPLHAVVNNVWSYTFTLPYVFVGWCL